jgi:replication factor C subunit 3/5
MEQNFMPWVEFYRPVNFDDIILDPLNKQIFKNIIETGYFPNLLFYGPPGTGKTTTIINLVNSYQEKLNQKNKELMIHLNASDERGIDIIRSQINQFVNSKTMFNHGMKFVILDEVDYMTKNAQQALRYLLQNYSSNVRFCLICNYRSKIDEGLQNEFISLRFNQLPREDTIQFLNNISVSENLNLSYKILSCIQNLYKSDIRSMINFIQSNQNMEIEVNVIDNDVWNELLNKLIQKTDKDNINNFIHLISINYNIDKKNIIKDFLNYIIRNYPKYVNRCFLNFVENLLHSQVQNNNVNINYSVTRLTSLLSI